MDTTQKFYLNSRIITRTGIMIDKVHNCADCPIRKAAAKRPGSLFAKMHNWHKNWWPGWQAHQTRTCPLNSRVITQE
jgi:hypothetical protein